MKKAPAGKSCRGFWMVICFSCFKMQQLEGHGYVVEQQVDVIGAR